MAEELQTQIYDAFVAWVRARRGDKLVETDSEPLFEGDVWVGAMAQERGLIDGIAHMDRKMQRIKLMTTPTNSHSDTPPPCSECALNIRWGNFSLQLKSSRWGLLALSLLSCAAIAWAAALVAIWS